MTERRDDMETLELMVDRVGLDNVLSMLADVCGEKADHVCANWHDEWLARSWKLAGCACDVASSKARKALAV